MVQSTFVQSSRNNFLPESQYLHSVFHSMHLQYSVHMHQLQQSNQVRHTRANLIG